jgi:hypothetical protein
MTKQKFYELVVIKTLVNARFDDRNPYYSIANYLDNIEDLSFNQIMMKLELKGVVSIPKKENFKKWGISYLCQLFGFVVHSEDAIFQNLFFKFLKTHKSIYGNKLNKENFGNLCFDVYVDSLTKDRDFSIELGSFLLTEFQDSSWFKDFFKLVDTFGTVNFNSYDTYLELKLKFQNEK